MCNKCKLFAFIRLQNGSYVGMVPEIKDGTVSTSVAGIAMNMERIQFVDYTQGIFHITFGVLIRRPSKRDISFRYFLLGNTILLMPT